ncbi:Asp/Glu racemase [Micromonospora globispora]|uniref:aspartate/glutamate racemase family protein n=1 Tax=Micromonospora globispora TaxID=1450148 RepID=UPI000D6F0DB3|nr:aspartate/glutamate racemase family protein [Micromonospora globispora]PWU55403.1 Asp/Glu racemase [Micromonospora globispora]RQW91802.1 Asp/Glu racemase [Micromonospora globispora]
MRIGMLHATPLAQTPAALACAEVMPDVEQWHLLDDRLLPDLKRESGLTPRLRRRFLGLLGVLLEGGADGVLVTCSSFSELTDVAEIYHGAPVVKPDAAMYRRVAADRPDAVALVASTESAFPPALTQLRYYDAADVTVHRVLVIPVPVGGEPDVASWRDPVATAIDQGASAIVLAQYSLGPAADALADMFGVPVHSGAHAAALELKNRLGLSDRSDSEATDTAGKVSR